VKTKEKLELGWKYLSTILLFVLGVMLIRSSGDSAFKSLPFSNQEGMVFIKDKIADFNLDEFDIKVKKEVINGDTVTNFTVNGEEISAENFQVDVDKNSWIEFKMGSTKKDDPMNKQKKIIRKRVEKSSK
jgi:hypothetical protein